MTDKLSHWLQGGALAVAVAALWYSRNRVTSVPPPPGAPAPQGSQPVLSLGSPGGQLATAPVNVGGSPVYLTYNYPATQDPTAAGNAGASVSVPPSYGNPPGQHRKHGCGCGCSNQCSQTQFSPSGLASAYAHLTQSDLSNLLGIFTKAPASPHWQIGAASIVNG